MRKTKSVLMVLAAISAVAKNPLQAKQLSIRASEFADKLDVALTPSTAARCWGRGAAFSLAMQHAHRIVCDA